PLQGQQLQKDPSIGRGQDLHMKQMNLQVLDGVCILKQILIMWQVIKPSHNKCFSFYRCFALNAQ
ncbi:hypothetical protein ACJX0J_020562, partial [Zea mays]